MTEVPARTISNIEGGDLTEDRKFGLIKFAGAEDLTLAIPFAELATLGSLALALAKSAPGSDASIQAFEVHWWNVSAAADAVVLTFDLMDGSQFSFVLPRDAASRMSETIAVVTGTPAPVGPAPRNTH